MSDGERYVARYWRHHVEESAEFDTAEQAAHFLESGEEDDWMAPIGVFDPAGNRMSWDRANGWPDALP